MGSSNPARATQMPNFSCSLYDVGITNVDDHVTRDNHIFSWTSDHWPKLQSFEVETFQFAFQGRGFVLVYNGPNLSFTVSHLHRNTDYKFKVTTFSQYKFKVTTFSKYKFKVTNFPQYKFKVTIFSQYKFRITTFSQICLCDSRFGRNSAWSIQLIDCFWFSTLFTEFVSLFSSFRPLMMKATARGATW